jgi:hypothetical protein
MTNSFYVHFPLAGRASPTPQADCLGKYFTSHLGDVSYGDSLTVRRPRILKEEGDFDPALSNPFKYLPIEKFQATIRSCWAAKVHDLSKLE